MWKGKDICGKGKRYVGEGRFCGKWERSGDRRFLCLEDERSVAEMEYVCEEWKEREKKEACERKSGTWKMFCKKRKRWENGGGV